jgi:protein TonB
MATSIAARAALPIAKPQSFEWGERPRAVPTPKLPPRWQEEEQSNRSPMPKWIGVAAAVLVVSAVPGWYFMTRHQHSVPAANAATVREASFSSDALPIPEPSTVRTASASTVQPMQSTAKVAPVASPIALKNVVAVPTPRHEEKPAAVETHKAATEPIILAANAPKAASTVDLDTIIPVKIPAMPETGAIALPTTAKSAPKLAAPTPDLRSGGALIKKVSPVYPQLAKSAGIQGAVELQVHVTPDGAVDKVRRLSGQPMLANAAIEAVKQWRYDPAKLNGKPVDMETTVRLNFDLAR